MSMATLEKEILAAAKRHFNNPKLRKKDLLEWSTCAVKAHEGEVTAWIADLGVYVAIASDKDKRTL